MYFLKTKRLKTHFNCQTKNEVRLNAELIVNSRNQDNESRLRESSSKKMDSLDAFQKQYEDKNSPHYAELSSNLPVAHIQGSRNYQQIERSSPTLSQENVANQDQE